MSILQKSIDSIQKMIEELEVITGVPAIPPVEKPKAEKQPKAAKPVPEKEPELPAVIAAFAKCEIRVTQVKTCIPVAESDKLLLMTLDVGNGTRTFAAGMAQFYKPEQMIGLKIVTILNLPPRPMCNKTITSEAMLFAGSYGEEPNRVAKLCIPDQSVPVGTRVVVEGFEQLPEAAGQPKKNFDRVVEVLMAKDGKMALDGQFLVAGGKRIDVEVPDGSHLG